ISRRPTAHPTNCWEFTVNRSRPPSTSSYPTGVTKSSAAARNGSPASPPSRPQPRTIARVVKKVVRRAELLKGHYHGFWFQVSGVLLIEAADNPRPVHQLCHQTQHPKQDHHLESPRARPEPLPALSFEASQQVVQKQKEK